MCWCLHRGTQSITWPPLWYRNHQNLLMRPEVKRLGGGGPRLTPPTEGAPVPVAAGPGGRSWVRGAPRLPVQARGVRGSVSPGLLLHAASGRCFKEIPPQKTNLFSGGVGGVRSLCNLERRKVRGGRSRVRRWWSSIPSSHCGHAHPNLSHAHVSLWPRPPGALPPLNSCSGPAHLDSGHAHMLPWPLPPSRCGVVHLALSPRPLVAVATPRLQLWPRPPFLLPGRMVERHPWRTAGLLFGDV